MPNHYLTKSTGIAIKDVDTAKGIVTGYFSAFGMPDSDGDIIRKGAYTKTILERGPKSSQPRIKHLLDHDTTKAIGKILELEEDEHGLKYVSKLGSHTLGRDALFMVQEGLITEHSVGFKTLREQKSGEFNEITEIMLWEGSSLQGWGANQNTPIVNVKNLIQGTKEERIDLFDRLNRLTKSLKDGSYSDDTMQLLEIEQQQIKQALKDSFLIELQEQKQAIKEALTAASDPVHLAADAKKDYAALVQLLKSFNENS